MIAVRMKVSTDTVPRFVSWLREVGCDGGEAEILGHFRETRVCRAARDFVWGVGCEL